MKKLSILFLTSLAFASAAHAQSDMLGISAKIVASEFLRLYLNNNQDAHNALDRAGYKIVPKESTLQNGIPKSPYQIGKRGLNENDYTRVIEITALSKSLTGLRTWNDVTDALEIYHYDQALENERSIRSFAESKCRDSYSKIREKTQFRQCNFRVGATYHKLNDDTANCDRDVSILYSSSSEEEKKQLHYRCMRNIGWKDPTDWKNNVEY